MFLFCNQGNRHQLKKQKIKIKIKKKGILWPSVIWPDGCIFWEYLSLSQIREKKSLKQKLNYTPRLWSKQQKGPWSTFSLCLFDTDKYYHSSIKRGSEVRLRNTPSLTEPQGSSQARPSLNPLHSHHCPMLMLDPYSKTYSDIMASSRTGGHHMWCFVPLRKLW